jgi:hypothetical protein
MGLSQFIIGVPGLLVGGGFSPSDVAGYSHDYDAAVLASLYQDSAKTTPVTGDGDPVGGWVEQNGTGDDVLQAVSADRYTYRAAVAALNNQPALDNDGTDHLSIASFAGGALAQPITIFWVGIMTSVAATKVWYDSPAPQVRLLVASGAYRMNAGANVDAGTPDTNAHIITTLFNGASSVVWVDGVQVNSGNPGANAMNGLFLGALNNGTFNMIGQKARVIIYSGDLSTADKNLIQNFLAEKYGISVSPFS